MQYGSPRKPESNSAGEQRADVRPVFHCERNCRTFEQGKAKDGAAVRYWCTHGRNCKVDNRSMEVNRAASQKAADAYRKGCEGSTMEQGESLAISVNPLVPRQIAGCQTSDLKQGKENSRCRWYSMDIRTIEVAGGEQSAETRIPTATPSPDLYSEEEWQEASVIHTDNV